MSTEHRRGGAQHRRGGEPRRHGRIVWHRFALALTPAVIALALLGLGATTGAVPVAVAVEGQQALKVSVKRYHADMSATFPSFFQDANGQKNTVLVLSLRNLEVQGLCVSTKVDTPMGPYVLRITTPDAGAPVSAGDVTLAIQDLHGLDLKTSLLEANKERPRTPTGDSLADVHTGGPVPLTFDQLRVNVNMTVRWLTANQLELSGLNVSGNLAQRECT